MPLALQTRLLRVLEELEVTPQLRGEGLDTDLAAHFKISRNTLYRKIKRHGIPIAHRSDGI